MRHIKIIYVLFSLLILISSCHQQSENEISLLVFPREEGFSYTIDIEDSLLVACKRNWEYDGQGFKAGSKIEEDGIKLSGDHVLNLSQFVEKLGDLDDYKLDDQVIVTDITWQFQLTIGEEHILTNDHYLIQSEFKNLKQLIDYLVSISPIGLYPEYPINDKYVKKEVSNSLILKDTIYSTSDNVSESEILLGKLLIDSVEYEVRVVIETVNLKNVIEDRGLLIFKYSKDSSLIYEIHDPIDLPDYIHENQLVFLSDSNKKFNHVVNNLNESLCFYGIKQCFKLQ